VFSTVETLDFVTWRVLGTQNKGTDMLHRFSNNSLTLKKDMLEKNLFAFPTGDGNGRETEGIQNNVYM